MAARSPHYTFADLQVSCLSRFILVFTHVVSVVCASLIGATGALQLLIALVVLEKIFGSAVPPLANAVILASCTKVINGSAH